MSIIYEEINLLSYEKHQVNRLSNIQEAIGLLSDTLQLLRGKETLTLSKSSLALKVMWSKTAASIETLNDVEKPPASLRVIPI